MGLNYQEIGERVARRRKELGFTQAALSERASISPTYMSSIERAKSIPSTEVIMRLAIALDTTPDEFLVGTAQYADEEWRDVAELLRQMDTQQLKLARSLLEWIKREALK